MIFHFVLKIIENRKFSHGSDYFNLHISQCSFQYLKQKQHVADDVRFLFRIG